jgi:hypothetical protein
VSGTCDSFLQGLVIRATRLDECGAPVYGAAGTIVSEGFINIELENQETDATEISQTKANGKRCYYIETPKLLNNVQASIEFCEVDPELFEMITGSPLVLDDAVAPKAHGFTTDSASYGVGNVAIELWTNLASGGCTPGQYPRRWGYYLMPWLYQGTVGKPTVENGAVNFTINEARTREGNQWGVGPYNIQRDKNGALSPLFTPITATTHDLLYKVNVAPPEASCGVQPLVALS